MNLNPARTHGSRAVRLAAGAVVGGIAVGAILLPAPASARDSAPDPVLRISVDNGGTAATAGDTLDYAIAVENLGTDAVRGLRVSQTLPEGMTFGSADRGGAAGNGQDVVVWSVDIKPTSTVTLHATTEVGATSDETLRIAVVACAAVSAAKPPLVCATDSDELPAGAAAADDSGSSPADGAGRDAAVPIGGAIALLVVAGGAFVLIRRRRASTAAPAAWDGPVHQA